MVRDNEVHAVPRRKRSLLYFRHSFVAAQNTSHFQISIHVYPKITPVTLPHFEFSWRVSLENGRTHVVLAPKSVTIINNAVIRDNTAMASCEWRICTLLQPTMFFFTLGFTRGAKFCYSKRHRTELYFAQCTWWRASGAVHIAQIHRRSSPHHPTLGLHRAFAPS